MTVRRGRPATPSLVSRLEARMLVLGLRSTGCDCRPRSTRRTPGSPLPEDRPQDAEPVPPWTQIALAMDSLGFEARHLADSEPRPGSTDVHQRLDFEALDVEGEVGKALCPEGVVAVAEVGVVGAV